MKRSSILAATAILLLLPLAATPSAEAAGGKFSSCAKLKKKFPNGIANSQMMADATGATLNTSLYAKNRALDKDGDGVACWGVRDT